MNKNDITCMSLWEDYLSDDLSVKELASRAFDAGFDAAKNLKSVKSSYDFTVDSCDSGYHFRIIAPNGVCVEWIGDKSVMGKIQARKIAQAYCDVMNEEK